MRGLLALLLLVSIVPSIGCQQAESTVGFASFGAAVEPVGVMALGEAVAKVDTLAGKPVCVRADIAAVCAKRGCWMMLSDGATRVRVRFTASAQCTDGFFVPRNAAGHRVFAKGVLESREVPEAEARHYAEDSGKSTEEIAKIVGPQKEVTMIATGVMISEGDKLDPPVD